MNEQGSQAWRDGRAGRITASCFAEAIAMKEVVTQRENKKQGLERKTKLVPTDTRNTYMRSLIAEILSGQPKPEVSSRSLEWGKEHEPLARELYELKSGNFVEQTGLVVHPDFDFIAASPDGLIDDDGGLEMKCPKDPQIHIKTWMEGMPDEHIAQIQGGMFVTGRKWWDFVSFDPRQTPEMRLFVQRISRNDQYIDGVLQPGLLAFWRDVQSALDQLRRKVG
ncbi:lambda exonuclease family protein [Chitiniphilus eburneus]|uniref:Exonuclease n=1 Tax=Chitiniphilus eburneus TaxID=2571148 RepID=A0A4U0Q5Z8_9NEIS|nr:lambda exonuclease family protein [Chitiniphilus eburneus]TJZ75612.1 exonuclease [Chitiniphilus eburneus]